jgi:hypothetical protein
LRRRSLKLRNCFSTVLGFIADALSISLPETGSKGLANTFQEGEEFGLFPFLVRRKQRRQDAMTKIDTSCRASVGINVTKLK